MAFKIICMLVIFSFVTSSACPQYCKCDVRRKSATCMGHHIRKVPRDLPRDTVSLSLIGTSVTVLEDELWTYRNLQGLNLGDNRLAVIKPFAFRGLRKLRYLDLRRNHLTDKVLQTNLFQDQSQLLWLNINKNLITKLTYPGLKSLKLLYKLSLSSNKIETISESALFGLENLKTLVLYDNKMTSVPGRALRHLHKLTSVSLANNLIKEVDSHAFRHAQKLRNIDLDGNMIERIEYDSFLYQKHLETLHLHKNSLTEIPVGAITYLTKLQYLDLDNNPIRMVSAHAFSGMKHLKSIKLSYMDLLESIDSMAFSNLPALTGLYLHNNPNLIEIAHDAFLSTPKLSTLQLHYNALEYMDKRLIPWDQMLKLTIHGNPWRCDCNLKWIAETLQSVSFIQHSPKCAGPRWLKNSLMTELSTEEFLCY